VQTTSSITVRVAESPIPVEYTHNGRLGTVIFRGAGISNSFVTQMILGGVNFGTTFGGLYIVEHFGRRKSLITGGIWMFCCFMVFASIGHFSLDIENPPATPGAGKAMVVFACLFITGASTLPVRAPPGTNPLHPPRNHKLTYLGFATTWGPMIWALIAELYPCNDFLLFSDTRSNWMLTPH
jgi:SP family sugar:H+ symporter-like MFS transporter